MWLVAIPLTAGTGAAFLDGPLLGISAAVTLSLMGWALAHFLGRCAELHPSSDQGGTMPQQTIRVTDLDSRRLQSLIEGPRSEDLRDAGSVELLERHLDHAEVMHADRIGPDRVTMNSEVQLRDLDTHETIVLRVVFPGTANAAAGKISVLAPLGMAVLGRRVGDHVTWQTPGGLRRLEVDRILYQPESEGKDSGSRWRSFRLHQGRRRA